jgi:hypothetical protein
MRGDLVTVWAIGDGVRVNPESGRLIEERPDIHADYPSGEYREKNVVWDASESRVVLHSARNEFISFQIVVGSEQPVRGLEVRFDRLLGPGGVEIAGRNVALFKAWYVRVRQPSTGYERTSLGPGWYPDALLPAPTGEPLRLDLPDEKNAIGESHRHQTVWVDIYLPRERAEAPPGTYRGTLSVSWPGGSRELEIELQVWDFALPDEIHCRGDIYNNSIQHMEPDLELRYFQMARRHGFQPGIVYHRPDLKVDGTNVHIDWSAYDDRLMKYLDGSAYTEARGYWGPGVGLPIDHIILPFDCGKKPARRGAWPIAMPQGGPTEEFEAVWVEAERQLREHFDADPHRRRVEKIVFLEGLDEAYYEDAYQQMIYYAGLLRRGLGKDWFKHRIDGGYSWEAMEKLYPYVDLVICHTIAFDAEKIAHFAEKGVESWCYGPMIYERRESLWVQHLPRPRPAHMSRPGLGHLEAPLWLLPVGVRMGRRPRLDRGAQLGHRARRIQRVGPAHLPRRGRGLPRPHSEHQAQGPPPRLPGLRVLLAAPRGRARGGCRRCRQLDHPHDALRRGLHREHRDLAQ